MCEINELKRGNIHWVKDHFYNENDEIEKEDTYHPYLIISSDRNNSGNSSNTALATPIKRLPVSRVLEGGVIE